MNFRKSEEKLNHLCLSFLVNYLDKKYKSVVSFNFSYNFNAVKNSISTMDGLTCCSGICIVIRFHFLLIVQWITAINTITGFAVGL